MRRNSSLAAVVAAMLLTTLAISPVSAAEAKVGLGTVAGYAVLAGSAVTNTGPTVINGHLGVSPASAVSGFPPGLVNGTRHEGNANANQAQSDLTTAYNDAAGRACDVELTGQDLGGMTLTSGVYCFSSSAQLTGTLTLDAEGDPNAVFIFQIGSTLKTASASRVAMINGAQACNVYWQVGSSVTLGTNTTFVGNILALTSISVNTDTTIRGRALARNGAVTLQRNVISRAQCGLVCTSRLDGGTYGSITVPDGATCTLSGVTVRGDVTIGERSRLYTRAGTVIRGDVDGEGAKTVRLINTEIRGDVDLTDTAGAIVIGSPDCEIDPVVGGSIRLSRNRGPISVCEMTVGASVVLKNNRSSDVNVRDNTIAGNLIVVDTRGSWLGIRDNAVAGFVRASRNTISKVFIIRNNAIVGNLTCVGNTVPPVLSSNVVGGTGNGQCAA